MKIYIRSSACISPQNSFGSEFLTDIVEYHGNRLRAIEPDYKKYVDPKLIRRMSHVIKMGVSAAQECLTRAGVTMPGAIITGTAYGCMEDTISFLTRIIEQDETMLSPTAFIQSTHNTVAAQIALTLQCHNYNNTFVHKGVSFESALLDAIMLLKENEANNILVGGLDEMTDTSFTILTRLAQYRRTQVSNLELFATMCKGTVGGEGAAFFLLTDKPSADNLAQFVAVKTLYKPKNIEVAITNFLQENSLTVADMDLLITGRNGDEKNDEMYTQLNDLLFKETTIANYKHLCGEYTTSPAFAFWVAAHILKEGKIPGVLLEKQGKSAVPQKILVHNHIRNNYHSLMLLSAV